MAEKKSKQKTIHAVGKRKRAIARATLSNGTGIININSTPLEMIKPRYVKMRIEEGLMLIGDIIKKVNIDVNVKGGGVFGQADAARTAIYKALVKFDGKLKDMFLDYDRSLLVSDPRRTEPHKSSRSSAGPRRKKQQSKR